MRKAVLAITISAVAGLGLLASPASSTPIDTGCPSNTEVHTIEEWAAMGYYGPARIDADGNGDGVVCGMAMPDGYRLGFAKSTGIEPTHDVLYLFSDNTVGSGQS